MKIKSIPNWTTNIEEISNNIYKVTLVDNYGRRVEFVDDALEEITERALYNAFDIEKKFSNNWQKFIYDFCLSELQLDERRPITNKMYSDKNFGSWLIEIDEQRILFVGKNSWLVFQNQFSDKWFDFLILGKEELDYRHIKLLLIHVGGFKDSAT